MRYDVAVYNHLRKKWVREGRTLAKHQAHALWRHRCDANPCAEYKVVPATKGEGS